MALPVKLMTVEHRHGIGRMLKRILSVAGLRLNPGLWRRRRRRRGNSRPDVRFRFAGTLTLRSHFARFAFSFSSFLRRVEAFWQNDFDRIASSVTNRLVVVVVHSI